MARARSRFVPEDIARLRLPQDARLSPDGDAVVYVEKRARLELDAMHGALQCIHLGSGRTQALTDGTHPDSAPDWSPDGRWIVFVSDRDGGPNLWRIARTGGAPERLTRLDGRVGAPRWSPRGGIIAFLHAPRSARQRALDPTRTKAGPRVRRLTALGYKHDGRGFVDDAYSHLYVFDTKTRRVRRLTSGPYSDGQHVWSPDGKWLAFVSNRGAESETAIENSDVFVISARGGKPRAVTRQLGPKLAPAWSPDGQHLAFIGHFHHPDTVENAHVWVIPARGGAPRDLVAKSDLTFDDRTIGDTRDVPEGETHPPIWSADGKRVFALATHEGATHVWEVPLDGGTPRQRTHGRHQVVELSASKDGRRWAMVRLSPTSPGEVVVASAARGAKNTTRGELAVPGARVERLTRGNDALLAARQVVTPEEIHIPCVGGHSVHAWVWRSPQVSGRGPTVLAIHGGPYAAYGWTFFHEFQMLASHGYHVVQVNLRGSAGYGRDFMRQLVGTWGSRDFEDLMRVADTIEQMPFVDPKRIAVAGGSYGGYLSAWAIGHTQRFRCAIAMRGVYNMISMYGASDMGWTLAQEFEDQTPWDSIDRYWRVSPLLHAPKIRTPLLLLHQEEDHRCPIGQAEELFTALRVLKRDVELVRFAGESHGMSRSGRPHNRIERLRLILDWFRRKL